MICVINNTIHQLIRKGESLEKARKVLKERYHINIDIATLRKRLKNLKLEYPA